MDVGLTVAGGITLALAIGHATIGLVWVLPAITREPVPETKVGPAAMTAAMVRVTWHIVTIFALASGGILLALALAPEAEPSTVVLRGFALMWAAATVMAFYVSRPRPRNLVRLPVPFMWAAIAVLCWSAAA